MGLDMYLIGSSKKNGRRVEPEGCPRRFGSWRKHWGLHTYLVNAFAGGMDEYDKHHHVCVELKTGDLQKVIAAIEAGEVEPQAKPPGYDPAVARLWGEHTASDLETFQAAIAWLEAGEEGETRCVYYSAND